MNKEVKTAGELVPQLISETSASVTTPPTILSKQQNDELRARMRVWCSRNLRIQTNNNPQLEDLERAAYRFCSGVWDTPTSGYLLVIYGANGNGKTHVARNVFNWIKKVGHARGCVTEKNHVSFLQAIFWHWPGLLDTLKSGNWDVVDDMFKIPVLILDEMAGGHDPSQVGTDKLCQVLSKRENKWTLVTTNVTPDEWESKFDKRIASRLFRDSEIVDLSMAPDFKMTELHEAPSI